MADQVTRDADSIMKEIQAKDSYRKASKQDTRIYLKMIAENIGHELEGLGEEDEEMSALDKWREVGEAAHEVVSRMVDSTYCDECNVSVRKNELHEEGCKVGRLVEALKGVGIDPEDR